MLIGFDSLKINLLNSHKNHKLHHAILIHGKKGIGKSTFIKELVQDLLETKNQNHPDLLLIEKDDGKKEISVEKIRKIAEFSNQTSAISRYKFIVIDSADELNKSSSNALLKILEEPHNNNFLILISHNPNKVLATIRSRCQELKVPDLSFEEFKKILQKNYPNISEDELLFLSEICDNSPAKAISNQEELIEIYQNFLESLENKKIDNNLYKKVSDKNFSFEVIEEIILFFLNRLLKFFSGFEVDFYFNEKEVFLYLKNNISFANLLDLEEKIKILLQKNKSLNLDKKLTLINVFNLISFSHD
ncbi:MAG: AAA family ATPase [Pelagibacterales bacterium]|nr:AAA family ATPase [Pelagibacterales bacterium]